MKEFKLFIAGAVVATWAWQLVALYEKRHGYGVGPPRIIACSDPAVSGQQFCSCTDCAMKTVAAADLHSL